MEALTDGNLRRELLEAYFGYFEAYTGRDWARMVQSFHPDMTMFGTGTDEVATTGEETLALFRREFLQAPATMTFEVRSTQVSLIDRDVALIMLVMDMAFPMGDQQLRSLGNRTSAILVRREGAWVIAHAHWSQPDQDTDPGSSVPFRQLMEEHQRLEAVVAERTEALRSTNEQLSSALASVKTLKGLLPICAHCKKVRSDKGYWTQIEQFLAEATDASFSHGVCPSCREALVSDWTRSALEPY